MAEEVGFWNSVRDRFNEGKTKGYNHEVVYEMSDETAIVESPEAFAEIAFWGPEVGITGETEEEEWLLKNTEECLCLEGKPYGFVYILRNRKLLREI